MIELSGENFGEMMRKMMTSDIVFPGFHKFFYERNREDSDPFAFVVDQYWAGFNHKLSSLLSYIQFCIQTYGRENVLF